MGGDGGSKAVDFAYLEGFAAGDRQVIDEVLSMFLQQAQLWVPGLTAENPDWRDLVHTIKGSARGIGANALGDVCVHCEGYGAQGLVGVRAALAAALAEIEAYRGAA